MIDTTNVETVNRIIENNISSRSQIKKNDSVDHPIPLNSNSIANSKLNFTEPAPAVPSHLTKIIYLNVTCFNSEKLL